MDKFNQEAVKFNGVGVMMFGGMWVGGRISLIRLDGKIDGPLYIEMLDTFIMSELRTAFPNMDRIW